MILDKITIHYIASHYITFHSILFYFIPFYSILFYSILFYSILFYSILFYYIILHYTTSAPLGTAQIVDFTVGFVRLHVGVSLGLGLAVVLRVVEAPV